MEGRKRKKTKVAIFAVYHKNTPIYETDILHPIQTGCDNASEDLHIMKDNAGDNISFKNTHYAELTAMYQVWKNYLKKHPEVEFIGFCHYRRFMDFYTPAKFSMPFARVMSYNDFSNTYKDLYNEDVIVNIFKGCDIILPEKYHFAQDVYMQYVLCGHPKNEFDKMKELVQKLYPDYVTDMNYYLERNEGYYCLNFIMKKKLFISFMNWIMTLLNEMDKISDWTQYHDYNSIKTPAYMAERFFNVWLGYQIRVNNIKIIERESILLA